MALSTLPAADPRTMRLDCFHGGTATEEQMSLDGLVLEGPWPGRLDRAIDDTNLGKYYFEVLDRKTNRVLYSRGFASVFGEWQETPEAAEVRRPDQREGAECFLCFSFSGRFCFGFQRERSPRRV
jgi:hypothetical protein